MGVMVLAALLGLPGCGGGGSDSTTAATAAVTVKTSSIDPAEFKKKATAICVEGISDVQKTVQKAIAGKGSVKAVESAVFPKVEGFIVEIGRLGAPKGEQAKVEAFLTSLQEDLEAAKANPAKSMPQLGKTFKDSGEAAQALKIEACALG
jgi:hypothetical protein